VESNETTAVAIGQPTRAVTTRRVTLLRMSDWNTSATRNIWRPEEPRLFVRRTDGIGWSINFAHLFRRTRRA